MQTSTINDHTNQNIVALGQGNGIGAALCRGQDKGSPVRTDLIKGQGIAYRMRQEGIKAECDSVGRSVKAQMKYANKIGSRYSVILGDNEIEQDRVKLKNMETGEEELVKVSELIDIMKNKK